MATIVNNPPPANNSGGSMVVIIALIVLLVLVYLGFMYGLPILQQMQIGGTQINVPNKIDVNIKQSE